MKRKSILGLLTISSLVLLTSCDLNEMFNQHYGETSGGEEAGTLTDEEVINGALNVTAILVDNAAAPVRDSANYPNYVNTLKAMSGGYLKAQTKLAYLGEDDHTYDVSLAWTFDSAKFKVQDYADEGYKILRPAYNTIGFNQSEVLNLTCTATYGAKTGTLNYKITAVNDKEVIAIKDLQNNTDACVQGYVTGKIMGTSDTPYGIYVQDGTYAMMVYNPTKEAYNSVVIGDLVEVTGTTSFYNNTKQFTGSKSTVTKITENEKVSTVLTPVETELEDVDNIATEHYGALYKLTGCKVVEAHNYSNWYGGTETRNAVIEVVLRYKGKNVTVTSDRYNANYEDKVAFYNKAIEVLDSNGAKTLDYVGPMAMVPHVTEPGNATTNTADTKVAGFSFISSDKATVSNAAYQPNIQVTISGLPAIIGVGDKFALTATVNDTDNTAVTWESSNDSIATVSETGNVEAKAEGEVTITATSVADTNKKASVTFTIVADAGEKSYLKKTVAEVLQVENTATQAYVVTGKIKGFGNNGTDANLSSNKYGSFILQDSNDDTKEILVYGSSTNNRDLAFKDGKYEFNRTVDMSIDAFANALAVGDEVTLIAIRADYGTTLELKGIFVAGANNARIPATSATIKQIIDSEPDASTIGGQKVYKSKGVITKWYQTNTNGTQYGNFYVKDDSTDTEVLVYGATAQENKISYNYNGSGKYTIGNPKDFLTNDATKDLKIGDEVEFECVRVDYGNSVQLAADSLKAVETDTGDDTGGDTQQTTVTFNNATDTGNASSTTASAYSVTKSDVTMSVSNGLINGHYRVYKNATATFDAGNKKIKSVTFECTASGTNQYGPGCFTVPDLNGEYTFAEKVGTWTGDQSSIVFTASSNQVRFTTCTVIYQ
ncbi:MAG: Ig-like domain-containing protein [Bacilli bacterium]|nr:Ig-like domain-containing protein [Bacilli bacterium]